MMLDPFKGDGFTMASLTAAIDRVPFVPSRIAQLGIFSNEGIGTPTAILDERNGVLQLVPNVHRGGPAKQLQDEKRKMRSLICAHLPLEDYISADDLIGIREHGTENVQASINTLTNRKLARMKQALAATLEWMRMGALKGSVLDGEGVEVCNLYTTFEIQEPSAIDFTLGTATTDIRGVCMDVIRLTGEALGTVPFGHVHAFCGPLFFKRLIGHADVKENLRWIRPADNINDLSNSVVEYGGILWEQYLGQVDGKPFVPTADVRFFPMGAPGIFPTYYAPSTWLEGVGQLGQPLFAKSVPTPDNTGLKLLAQSNPLPICLIPAALRRGYTSN